MILSDATAKRITLVAVVFTIGVVGWAYIAPISVVPTGDRHLFAFVGIAVGSVSILAAWLLTPPHPLVIAAGLISLSIAGALWANTAFDSLAGTTWAVCLTAVTTFVAILISPSDRKVTKNSMRNAIAGSVTITYLVAVGLTLFFQDSRDEIPLLTSTLLSSFTQIVSIVVGFYFAGATVEKAVELRQVAANPSSSPQLSSSQDD
jgi:hypothetical protein